MAASLLLAAAADLEWTSLLYFIHWLLNLEKCQKSSGHCVLVTVNISLSVDDLKKKRITLYSVSLQASRKLHFLPLIFEYKAVILGFPAPWKKTFHESNSASAITSVPSPLFIYYY